MFFDQELAKEAFKMTKTIHVSLAVVFALAIGSGCGKKDNNPSNQSTMPIPDESIYEKGGATEDFENPLGDYKGVIAYSNGTSHSIKCDKKKYGGRC